MLEVCIVEAEGRSLLGVKLNLKPPLLLLIYKEVLFCCGYFSIEAMERFGKAACIVRGVSNFEEMLNSSISDVSSKALELGIERGMAVREALKLI